MAIKKVLIPSLLCGLLSFACAYIVVPADLMVTPTSTASQGWSGVVTNVGTSDAGDLHIDLAIRNDTQDWSAMQAAEGKPAVLTTSDGERTNCDTVFVGTGGTSLAPGFQMQGYTAGTKREPKTQLLYVECQRAAASEGAGAGSTLSINYDYVTGDYDLHIPSIPVNATMTLQLDNIAKDIKYPVATPVADLIVKSGDKINAINSFLLTLTDVKRTETDLELHWQTENPTDYPNYVHIGRPPVIGADGIIYGVYEDPSIAEATITLPKETAEWTTTVEVPGNIAGLYVLVSVETRQSKYFVNHVIDITDK
ncbi:MAG: hypothetical protein AB1649_01950 [Chloroflexota bacterium]